MNMIDLPLLLLSMSGFWETRNIKSSERRRKAYKLYQIYSGYFELLTCSLMLIRCLILFATGGSFEEIIEIIYILLVGILCLTKYYCIMLKQKQLSYVVKLFSNKICLPHNLYEIIIQSKYKKCIR